MTDLARQTDPTWQPDILGAGYEQHTFDLGRDPDGEGRVAAVVVRRAPSAPDDVTGVALYVHGFSDYFFQRELADFFDARGQAFYGLDLRKCGRARRPGQTAHYCSTLELYDDELDRTLALIEAAHPGLPVTLVAHSTGGLIAPLYLDRQRRAGRPSPVRRLVLNSPWLDLQGPPVMRGPVTWLLRVLALVRPFRALKLPESVYGDTLHLSKSGEWDYDVDLKPLSGFPVTIGWLNAVRRGHATVHRGVEVGVPTLVLHSDKTSFKPTYTEASDRADLVLDVRQIAHWAGSLGADVTTVAVPDARHDIFLSLAEPRRQAYDRLDAWMKEHPTTP
ncbi:alpha/beta hydrolase [Spongisporangium articulatum]|uniref:Alpha/beta hydrolase n=1 Tax=Spongisporangium articulatum TaxID=3362603 RepID=A0ABW8AR11_9ACTN